MAQCLVLSGWDYKYIIFISILNAFSLKIIIDLLFNYIKGVFFHMNTHHFYGDHLGLNLVGPLRA